MAGRRSGRLPTLPSATSFLDEVEPAHRAITRAQAGLTTSGPTYAALDAAREALDRVAAALGLPGRFHGLRH